jgi:hypothetical protein
MSSDSVPKAAAEQVMTHLLDQATRLLERHGEFYPIAGFLDSTGVFQLAAVFEGDDHPASERVIANLRALFLRTASLYRYRAIGLAYDVRAIPPGASTATDAVLVELEHRTGYRVNVYWPYTRTAGDRLTFGEPFALAGTMRCYALAASR